MAFVLGKDFILYYDEDGAADGQATPANWIENDNIMTLNLNLEKNTSDVSTRGGGNFRAVAGVLSDGSTDFQMIYDPADPHFDAFQRAFFGSGTGFVSAGGIVLGIAVMDGDITTPGVQGLVADMMVLNFSVNEDLEEAGKVDVTVAPTFSSFTTIWFTVP